MLFFCELVVAVVCGSGGQLGREGMNGGWELVFQAQIHADLHRLKVCFLIISPQRARRKQRILLVSDFASFAVHHHIKYIFQQPCHPPAAHSPNPCSAH